MNDAMNRLLDFDRLLPDSVRAAMHAENPAAFLHWARAHLSQYAPRESPVHSTPEIGRALAFAWSRAVWNSLPLNAAGEKPASVPEPGRNEPCPCGSGVQTVLPAHPRPPWRYLGDALAL